MSGQRNIHLLLANVDGTLVTEVIEAVRRATQKPLNVHLMIVEPDRLT
jgi:pentose-5-phosphate-3-epimerase